MSIIVLGVSHNTAPIEVRERVALDAEQLTHALKGMVAAGGVREALVLSTCNRTEFYCCGDQRTQQRIADWLVKYKALEPQLVERHFYTLQDTQAIRHALRVACGLDSMVLGEPQILGQLKGAYRAAVGAGTTGKQLNKLMQYAFAVAKRIRTETAIGATPVSVAYAAVRLARQIHGDLHTKRALLIGAGETVSLVAHHLRQQGIAEIVIANRTLSRSEELAREVGGTAIALADIPGQLVRADIIVSSTASRLPIITHDAIAAASRERRYQPMFIVDLAVPRDVEATVADLDDVYLYTVDDLNHVITENLELRRTAAAQAEEIVNVATQGFLDWLASLDGNAVIVAFRQQAEAAKIEALDKAHRRLAAGDTPEAVLAGLANTLVNKLIHHPTTKIREATIEGRSELIASARELWAIDGAKGEP